MGHLALRGLGRQRTALRGRAFLWAPCLAWTWLPTHDLAWACREFDYADGVLQPEGVVFLDGVSSFNDVTQFFGWAYAVDQPLDPGQAFFGGHPPSDGHDCAGL